MPRMNLRHALRPHIERLGERFRLKIVPHHVWLNINLDAYDHDLLTNILGPVRVVVDVGANEGQTVSEIRTSFPDAQIYAFEPGAEALQLLKQNWGGDPKVSIVEAAATSHDGTAKFIDDPDRTVFSRIAVDPAAVTREVQCTTLDTWCSTNAVPKIDLLKIDTEGHDLEVIEGAAGLLAQGAISAFVLEYGGHRDLIPLDQEVISMHTHGYQLAFTFAPWVVRSALHHGNALFIRADLAPNLRMPDRS